MTRIQIHLWFSSIASKLLIEYNNFKHCQRNALSLVPLWCRLPFQTPGSVGSIRYVKPKNIVFNGVPLSASSCMLYAMPIVGQVQLSPKYGEVEEDFGVKREGVLVWDFQALSYPMKHFNTAKSTQQCQRNTALGLSLDLGCANKTAKCQAQRKTNVWKSYQRLPSTLTDKRLVRDWCETAFGFSSTL